MATRNAPVQRQYASVIGGTCPARPRPSTMLPAQNRLASTRRVQAEFHRRVIALLFRAGFRAGDWAATADRDGRRGRACRDDGGSIRSCPTVAPRIGTGHAYAVVGDADRLNAARAFQRCDAVQ